MAERWEAERKTRHARWRVGGGGGSRRAAPPGLRCEPFAHRGRPRRGNRRSDRRERSRDGTHGAAARGRGWRAAGPGAGCGAGCRTTRARGRSGRGKRRGRALAAQNRNPGPGTRVKRSPVFQSGGRAHKSASAFSTPGKSAGEVRPGRRPQRKESEPKRNPRISDGPRQRGEDLERMEGGTGR